MNMHKLYITNGHWEHFCHGSKETDLGHMGSDYQGFGLFNVNLKVNWPKKKILKKNQYSQPPLWPNAKKLVTLEILQNFLSSPDSEFTKTLQG